MVRTKDEMFCLQHIDIMIINEYIMVNNNVGKLLLHYM